MKVYMKDRVIKGVFYNNEEIEIDDMIEDLVTDSINDSGFIPTLDIHDLIAMRKYNP